MASSSNAYGLPVSPGPPNYTAINNGHDCEQLNCICHSLLKQFAQLITDDARVERLGEELASDSPVWLQYASTAASFDSDMIDGWNKSLDVLLVFVSIFSIARTI